jgi:hypothetical protein
LLALSRATVNVTADRIRPLGPLSLVMAVEFRNPTEPKLTGSVLAVAGAVNFASVVEITGLQEWHYGDGDCSC